ncbi:hypothetical protein [Thermococcus aciditolerans]|uniref:Uncharacterized protein n=1 Tax=Thermococcus aciditolerans TaxID=2598455 RepID=A0A5C0SMX4_9EURY|nr:hypothetical protein [Thermococcus aciditolerans]QEK14249.1 hypothetical protein FPV09_03025 [Thermococcus aciditolerans]
MKLHHFLYPFLFPAWEFLLMVLLPREYYVGATCLQIHPYPICRFYFEPSPLFFLVAALPFIIVALLALWRDRKGTAVLSASSGVVVLVGLSILRFVGGTALLAVLVLPPLLQWAFARIVGLQIERGEETSWTVSAVLSFLAVWTVVRMGLAVSV